MNKKEMAAKLAERTNISQVKAIEILNAVFGSKSGEGSIIIEALDTNDKVVIAGFGTFETRNRDARAARNPGTGAVVKVPERTYVRFSAGKSLREKVVD